LTDDEFQEDDWGKMEMLETCEACEICQKTCPNQAIQTDEFVLDVNKCLSLYNEINGEIPDWVPDNAHNALIGCLKCQYPCPANKNVIKFYKTLEEITEDETEAILTGNPNDHAKRAIVDKLKMGSIEEFSYHLKTLQRNLKNLL
jgi:epoxyqueuosine reductase